MPEFNPQQFRQNSFDGYGNRAMRPYRVAPQQPQAAAAPQQPSAPTGWTQPQLPDPPAAPRAGSASPRLTPAAQARADISAARDQARAARVATAQANARTATHRQSMAEARATQTQQRAARATATPRRVDPSAVTDNTPPRPDPGMAGPGRQTSINQLAYRNTGTRFGPPPPEPDPPASPARPAPATPARPAVAPQGPTRQPLTAGAAGRVAGALAVVGARSIAGIDRFASDPKKSGNPLTKSTQGWMRS
ncbi:hypothetical protein ACWEDZ_02070 [Streptomyces sp. NPDC005047]